MLRRAALLLGVVALAACNSAPRRVPLASDYDRSCTTNEDCTETFVGAPACCEGLCPNAAIRSTELDRAQTDTGNATSCHTQTQCFKPACEFGPAYCVGGLCQLWHHPTTLSIDNYDRTCVTVDDCQALFLGAQDCCASVCPNVAVNVRDAVFAISDSAAAMSCDRPCADAGVDRRPCDGRISCEDGLCRFASAALASDGGAEP